MTAAKANKVFCRKCKRDVCDCGRAAPGRGEGEGGVRMFSGTGGRGK